MRIVMATENTRAVNKDSLMAVAVAADLHSSRTTTKSVDLTVTTISTAKALLTIAAHPMVETMTVNMVSVTHTSYRDLVPIVAAEVDLNEVVTA